jgi:predicted HTH domain antitoxin
MSTNEITLEIQMLVAVKLYEMKKISSGAAAALAGISKPVFLSRLYLYGIDTFNLTKEELISDLNNA